MDTRSYLSFAENDYEFLRRAFEQEWYTMHFLLLPKMPAKNI